MKSVKQNTIRQSIDQHPITLIESKQRFTTKLKRPRLALDGYKKNKPSEASAVPNKPSRFRGRKATLKKKKHRLLI